ncbi:MAG: hypothetical protein PHC88_02735 [Terrimicrobiaceae bacterium]|nr:hypothetical protein [Terrimicrobiaceae bacterium]
MQRKTCRLAAAISPGWIFEFAGKCSPIARILSAFPLAPQLRIFAQRARTDGLRRTGVRHNVPPMRRILPVLACLAAVATAQAQQQEEGMLQRIESARPDSKQVNPMQNQTYSSGTFATKTFGASGYAGVKSAGVRTFETKSFFGIKNPWFGRKIFDTYASRLDGRDAMESRRKYRTDAFAVREFAKGGKPDLRDADARLPASAQPRPYLIAGKTQHGLDRFTENLHKELTIDDVRDLLNKGKGE